ncbi:alpha-mannosidase [Pontivivens ytuae]|uniref:Alpha-mannosidase n=1 Tax=Pontivivens ytuae TaxID=2789856 RepID=A0A7S9LSQ1_9RHOB|nr:glycoside hydrolase family 38 C-terminal domain-containing protein [Pontivivens ytuae]QPH54599.1 alpha-mannosidase [Pontivivens ytuae]
MAHSLRLTAEKIGKRLDLIRPLVAQARVPIEPFHLECLPSARAEPGTGTSLGPLEWESYWGGADLHFVLRSRFTVPAGWRDPALHLPLGEAGDIFTHPEALLHIDGRPLASADRYHHTVDLAPELADGLPHDLMLHGWTGLTGWPPDPNDRTQLFIRECGVIDLDRPLQEFVTLAEVSLDMARALHDDRPEKHALLNALDRAFLDLDTRDPLGSAFRASVPAALAGLKGAIEHAGSPLDVTLHGIGHAHMDVAYLWPIAQIRRKNARTYSNVLRLMERHRSFRFSHSQPQLYAWTEEDYPELFEEIREQVQAGRWEILGGMWVEPDANMPGAEALVRQILLARQYVRTRFGEEAETPVLWLPDTFGFPASLPQLMKQAGLRWFATNKVSWNQYNQMPSSTTWWEGIDGSRVLAQFLTTPRDVQHLPFPTNYKSDLSAGEVVGTWTRSTMKSSLRDLMICYGYGDGGGGPTDELIRKAGIWGAMPGAPRVVPSTVRRFFETIESQAHDLPMWSGEFYLEGHRGVLTSQGWIKGANRRAEVLLHDTEYMASLLRLAGHDVPDLYDAWRRLCTTQFHDILTGTSISAVYDDARRDHGIIAWTCGEAMEAAAPLLAPPGASHLLVNATPLDILRQAVIEGDATAYADETGRILPAQAIPGGLLVELPGRAYTLTALHPVEAEPPRPEGLHAWQEERMTILENPLLRVEIGPDGLIHRLHDRETRREILRPGAKGNQLQAFEDRPISWDAWDIDIFFEERSDAITHVESLELIETGPLRAAVDIHRRWRDSTIRQRVVLHHSSRRLDFVTEIDWQESHVLLKAAFPVSVRSPLATYEIQWGQIMRPTHRNTSWDAARFEVPAQKWADLSEGNYGVALLNDGKYGYDIRGDVIRLSLIKSATMPDRISDRGRHAFTYSLMPHPGDWRGEVPAQAYALNHPVRVFPLREASGALPEPPLRALDPNVVIETVKPAEDGDGLIVRLYEAHRNRGPVRLAVSEAVTEVEIAGLLEDPGAALPLHDGTVEIDLTPYQIVTLRLRT